MTARVVLCLFAFAAVPAAAQPVYKCEEEGKITYTDRPCAPGAQAAALPELIVARPPGRTQQAAARSHDARIAREQAERERADAQWLKEHAQQRDREARVRRAIIEHRVIRGMTLDEVRQALGEPDRVQNGENFGTVKETWTYVQNGQQRVVNFKDGEMISTSVRKKSRRGRG